MASRGRKKREELVRRGMLAAAIFGCTECEGQNPDPLHELCQYLIFERARAAQAPAAEASP